MREQRASSYQDVARPFLPVPDSQPHVQVLVLQTKTQTARTPHHLVPHLIVLVGQIQVPIGALLGEDDHADNTARAAVPLDGLAQGALDKIDGLVFLHILLPISIAVAVDVGRAGAADRIRLLVQRAAQGNLVNLATMPLVPAGDDEAGAAKGRKSG